MPYRYGQRVKAKKRGIKPQYVVLAIVGLVVVVATLELTHTTHFFVKRKLVSSTIPSEVSTSAETQQGQDTSTTATPSSSDKTPTTTPSAPPDDKTDSTPASGAQLVAPSGSFVSNHRPSLSSASSMESICTTTAGATCTITFTKNGITKTLEAKKTDNNGTVIWTWDIKTAGFEAGIWNITATATLHGQSKSADDLQPLEVRP